MGVGVWEAVWKVGVDKPNSVTEETRAIRPVVGIPQTSTRLDELPIVVQEKTRRPQWLHFSPFVGLSSSAIIHFEALIYAAKEVI